MLDPIILSAYTTLQIVKERTPNSLDAANRTTRTQRMRVVRSVGRSRKMVEPGGIEPPTPCLQSRCSPS